MGISLYRPSHEAHQELVFEEISELVQSAMFSRNQKKLQEEGPKAFCFEFGLKEFVLKWGGRGGGTTPLLPIVLGGPVLDPRFVPTMGTGTWYG